jgi:hypothetical protein
MTRRAANFQEPEMPWTATSQAPDALAQTLMAPLICRFCSSAMLKYLFATI